MAYKSNDIQEVVAVIDRNNGAVKVSQLLDKDTKELKSIDVRYYYMDKVTEDLKPSEKGVRLNITELPQFMGALKSILEEHNLDM